MNRREKLLREKLNEHARAAVPPPRLIEDARAAVSQNANRPVKAARKRGLRAAIALASVLFVAVLGVVGAIALKTRVTPAASYYAYDGLAAVRLDAAPEQLAGFQLPKGAAVQYREYRFAQTGKAAFVMLRAHVTGNAGVDDVLLIAEATDARGKMFAEEYGAEGVRRQRENGEYYGRYAFTQNGVQYYLKVCSSYAYGEDYYVSFGTKPLSELLKG